MDYYLINYGLLFLGVIITLLAQAFVSISYRKYKGISNFKRVNGYEMARYILDMHNLKDVNVVKVYGELSDHYDPRSKVVRLSNDIYEGTSIASIAVAAHECGHAIQDATGYFMMKLRSMMVPIVNFSSYAGYIAIMIGLIAGLTNLIWIGIYFEIAILLFQIVTLPVEINASKRGLKELKTCDMVDRNDYSGSKIMLIAAASTYVASVATTLLQVLRLVLMVSGKRKD